jgi:hypothetical protein
MHIQIYEYINGLLRYDMKQLVKYEWKESSNLSDANGAVALASISRFTCCKASSSVTVTIKNQVCKSMPGLQVGLYARTFCIVLLYYQEKIISKKEKRYKKKKPQ